MAIDQSKKLGMLGWSFYLLSKAKKEFDVIDQVRESMGGVGIEKIFKVGHTSTRLNIKRFKRQTV